MPERQIKILQREIRGFQPLDMQFGVEDAKHVPDQIKPLLFGPMRHGNAAPTYAILDAAKCENLALYLEQSGPQFRCLFKGEAHDKLALVAPYLVALKSEAPFTRKLFTAANMPGDLWDLQCGVSLREAIDFTCFTTTYENLLGCWTKPENGSFSAFGKPMSCPLWPNMTRRILR